MMRISKHLKANWHYILFAISVWAVLAWLMLYRLGSLVGGLSAAEQGVAVMQLGWHGIYSDALYLPLNVIRSAVFYLFTEPSAFLIRLPNVFFGLLSIVSFTWLIWLWHGRRTALFAGLLFATGAWTLHVSRLASFDGLYLWVIPTMLLMNVALQRFPGKAAAVYGNMLLWGMALYIPGMVWLVLLNVYSQRKAIAKAWKHFGRWWQRLAYLLVGAIWLPLLINSLRQPDLLKTWLGLSMTLEAPLTLLKQFAEVFYHLFIKGPQDPELWLSGAPVLDVFTLAMCVVGLHFYASHPRASRSKLLGGLFLAGAILVALGGPVGLSLLVPLLYIVAATGITYLVKEWLRVFPLNPLARGLCLGLVVLAVTLSCVYNLRAYFVAWPHNDATKTVFRYRL